MMSFLSKSRTKRRPRSAVFRGVFSGVLILWGITIADRVESRDLVIGRVSSEPQRAMARVEKLAGYLAKNTEDLGVTKGRAVIVSTRAQADNHRR